MDGLQAAIALHLELEYTLLSRKENVTLDGRKILKMLLWADKRLSVYVLEESSASCVATSAKAGAALLRVLVCKHQVAAALVYEKFAEM